MTPLKSTWKVLVTESGPLDYKTTLNNLSGNTIEISFFLPVKFNFIPLRAKSESPTSSHHQLQVKDRFRMWTDSRSIDKPQDKVQGPGPGPLVMLGQL